MALFILIYILYTCIYSSIFYTCHLYFSYSPPLFPCYEQTVILDKNPVLPSIEPLVCVGKSQ
jgi:hypothetical protein